MHIRIYQLFSPLFAMAVLSSFFGCSMRQVPQNDLGKKIAGTYLAVTKNGSRIVQIERNGNLSLIMTEQLIGGGTLGESYSNTMGSWKKRGEREIATVTVDLSYFSQDSSYMGVAKAACGIMFNEEFTEATMACDGAVYPPEADPLAPDAKVIEGTRFVWKPTRFRRVLVE